MEHPRTKAFLDLLQAYRQQAFNETRQKFPELNENLERDRANRERVRTGRDDILPFIEAAN